jgi:hypothetical protein
MNRYEPATPQKRPDLVYKKFYGVGSALSGDRRATYRAPWVGKGMPQDRISDREVGRHLLTRTALCGALAATMIFGGTAAWAGDDDGGGPSVISSIMHTLGFKAPGDTYAGIDYNERSPLVVPPTRDLPPPVSNAAPPVANWPKDMDVARKKKAKVDDKPRYQVGDSVMNDARVLRPDELDKPGASRASASGDGDSTANSMMTDPNDHSTKKSLFSGLFKKDQQYTTFTGEPTRETLTEPPPGYMTPSPDQPYGMGPAESKYKVPTLADRMEAPR